MPITKKQNQKTGEEADTFESEVDKSSENVI